MAPSLSSYQPTETSNSDSSENSCWREDQVILHKVLGTDTIAGVAVKYNVTIADIKNSNGLNSDMALFARNTIVIPPKRAAPGDRYTGWWDKYTPPYTTVPTSRITEQECWENGPDDLLATGCIRPSSLRKPQQQAGPMDVELMDVASFQRRVPEDA